MNQKILRLLAVNLLFTLGHQVSFAQKAFEKSVVLINGGVVLYSASKPITVSAEYGITDQIGAGVRGHYNRWNNRYSIFNSAVYANYHFARFRRVDPFAGLMLDKTYFNSKDNGIGSISQPINLNVQLGTRYLFTNKFGAYAQVIFPFGKGENSSGELGFSLKL